MAPASLCCFERTTAWTRTGSSRGRGNGSRVRLVVIGSLSLYLDFINLFLLLLRVSGVESHK